MFDFFYSMKAADFNTIAAIRKKALAGLILQVLDPKTYEHQEKPICLAMANMYFFTKKWPGMAFLACLLDNVSQIHESHAMTRLHFSRSFS